MCSECNTGRISKVKLNRPEVTQINAGSVGKALLALSQFCQFNGKTIKWQLKITVLFLYADVIYKVSIIIIFIFIITSHPSTLSNRIDPD